MLQLFSVYIVYVEAATDLGILEGEGDFGNPTRTEGSGVWTYARIL